MTISRRLRLSGMSLVAGLWATAILPAAAIAQDPPCASLYPSPGPAGVDLEGACIANEVAQNYTSSAPSANDALWTLVLVLGAAWVAAVVVYAAWRYVVGRAARRLAPVAPTSMWLCDACHSFNAGDARGCYRCRRVRPADARLVDASESPPWEQRFGRPFGS